MAVKSIAIRRILNRKGEVRHMVDFYDQRGYRQRPSFKTDKEAKDFKRELQLKFSKIGSGANASCEDVLIHEAIQKYDQLKSSAKTACKEDRRYFDKMYDFFFDVCGLTTVQEIKPIHCEQLQVHLRKSVSASTVNRHFNTYRNFFSCLVRWGSIAKSPTEGLQNLPMNPTIRKVWDIGQVRAVLTKLPECYGDFLYFMAQTGARNKEVRDLNWSHVDFGRRVVTVMSVKGNQGAKYRPIPMTQILATFLAERLERAMVLKRSGPDDAVFLNTRGNRIQNQALDEAVVKARETLKLEDHLTPYGLRHFLVTSLHDENQGEEKIRRLVGHSRTSEVTSKYSHLNVRQLRDAMESTEQSKTLTRDGHHWAAAGVDETPELPMETVK